MENAVVSVKDFILDEKNLSELKNGRKKEKEKQYSYHVIMQSGCDFAIERVENRKRKGTRLVILVSQEQYYIEEGTQRNPLTRSNLKSFFRYLDKDESVELPMVSWIEKIDRKSQEELWFTLRRNEYHTQSVEMIRKGDFFLSNDPVIFGFDRGFGIKKAGADKEHFCFDFVPQAYNRIHEHYDDFQDPFGNPFYNGVVSSEDYDQRYCIRCYAGYVPKVDDPISFYGIINTISYNVFQVAEYVMCPPLYRYMLGILTKRRGITKRELLSEVISDKRTIESKVFQSFFAFALVEKAYGLDIAKRAMDLYIDSGIDDIIPYDQMYVLLFGNESYSPWHATISRKKPLYNLSGRAFIKYLFEEPIKQGYSGDMRLFLYHWGQILFLQRIMELPDMEKYPRSLASFAVKLISNASDYADIIDRKIYKIAYDHAKDLEYVGDKYKIVIPRSRRDMVIEADQQSNCLRTYISRFFNCETKICFLRMTDKKKENDSLVTIEVDNNNIVRQVKGSCNSVPGIEIWEFVTKWEQEKGLEDRTGYNPFCSDRRLAEQCFNNVPPFAPEIP